MSPETDEVHGLLNRIEPDYTAIAAKGSDVLRTLMQLAATEDPEIASRALYALGAVTERLKVGADDDALGEVAAVLARSAEGAHVLLRLAAASAAHALPPELAFTIHRRSLRDEDPGVRKTALEMAPRALTEEHAALCEELRLDPDELPPLRQMAEHLHESHPRA